MTTTLTAQEAEKNKKVWKMFEINPFDLDFGGKPSKLKVVYAQFMVVFSMISALFLILQIVQIYSHSDAMGQSFSAYVIFLIGQILWIIYGSLVLANKNMPIVWGSIVSGLLSIPILTGIVLYGKILS